MRKTFYLAATVLLALSVTLPAQQASQRVRLGDWPELRGPNRDGISKETGLISTWKLNGENFLWRVPYGGRSTPVVMGDRVYVQNPVGRGFHKHIRMEWVEGMPLPATEEIDRSVRIPGGDYRPMAFGPIGRSWEPRFRFAGTYDDVWREKHFPFLPPDFDEQYFQAAPFDQQVPLDHFRHGPAEVVLANLTPGGQARFTIPLLNAPVHVFTQDGEREDHSAMLDTVVIEPDEGRFSLTWRATRPLKKDIFEIAQVLVGKKGREWWQQREAAPFPIPVIMVPMEREDVPEAA